MPMATGEAASRALRLFSPGRCGRFSRRVSQPGSHRSSLAPIHSRPHASPLRNTATAGRRTLFSLAAAALGQARPGSGGPHQTLTTVRTLPYAAGDLFRIIADVDAYAQFLPHCTASRVTHWRTTTTAAVVTTALRDEPAATTNDGDGGDGDDGSPPSWPARADLTVGWGPLSQTYSSRVYCVPGRGVVEAVSGRAGAPTLAAAERAEIGLGRGEDEDGRRLGAQTASDDDTFESLVTRWTVVPVPAAALAAAAAAPPPLAPRAPGAPPPRSRVELHIRFQFRNPLYQIAAAQVGGEMATKMIDAFESRAEALLGGRAKARQL